MEETKGKKLYIAYGSNLNLEQMAYRCPAAEIAGTAEIEGYELLFKGGKTGAVATIEPKEGGRVPVIIWKITPKDEARLDMYEGYPHFYRKENIEVATDSGTQSIMAYVMNEGHRFGMPSPHYYDAILAGYQTAGFDTDVLESALERSEILGMEQEQSGIQMGM